MPKRDTCINKKPISKLRQWKISYIINQSTPGSLTVYDLNLMYIGSITLKLNNNNNNNNNTNNNKDFY